MKKKTALIICILLCLTLSMALLGCAEEQPTTMSQMDMTQQALALIQSSYIGNVDIDKLDVVAAKAIIESLDRFSYVSDTLYSQSSSANLGLNVRISAYNEYFVDTVFAGLPADQTFEDGFHLKRGDELYGISNSNIVDDEGNPIFYRLRGTSRTAYESYVTGGEGTVLTLRIYRDGEYKGDYAYTKSNVYIPRATYIADVFGEGSDVGYIRLMSFTNTETVGEDGKSELHEAGEDFVQMIETFKSDGMTKLVLDLRGNGGGDTKQLARIASYFVPLGENGKTDILQLDYKKTNQVVHLYVEEDNYIDDLSLVILCNSGTASAAEALIGACRAYHHDTTVIGTQTFGKGVFQRTGITLKDRTAVADYVGTLEDYYVTLVCGYYYIVDPASENGRYCIHDEPLSPDISVKPLDQPGVLVEDPEMVEAYNVLLGGSEN